MILSMAASKQPLGKRVVGLWDARVAFFHALMDEFTVVRPPRELRRPGFYWILLRALYGTRRAGKLFGKLVAEILEAAGYLRLQVIPNAYNHPQRDVDVVVHGDDFMADGEDHQLDVLEQTLENAIELKRVGRVGPGRQAIGHMLKRTIRWGPEGFSWEADPSLVDKLLQMLGLERAKPSSTPGAKEVGRDDRDILEVLSERDRKLAQSAAGLEQYLALDRPDIMYAVKTALQGMSQPDKLMMLRVVRIARYLLGVRRLVWRYKYQQMPTWCCEDGDADFASRETQLRSTTGTVGRIGAHTIDASSSTQSVRALSTGEAEFYGIVKAAANCLQTQAIMKGFGVELQAYVFSDATAGIGIASRQGSGRVKHLEVRWLWVQDAVAERRLFLKKQKSETNGADLCTKYLPRARIEFLLGLLGLSLVEETGAASTALSTQVAGTAAYQYDVAGLVKFLAFLAVVVVVVAFSVAFVVYLKCCKRLKKGDEKPKKLERTSSTTTQGAVAAAAASEAASPGTSRAGDDGEPARRGSIMLFLTADELKVLARSRGLPLTGSRAEIAERVVRFTTGHNIEEILGRLLVDELRVLCRARGLGVSGAKRDLVLRLVLHASPQCT